MVDRDLGLVVDRSGQLRRGGLGVRVGIERAEAPFKVADLLRKLVLGVPVVAAENVELIAKRLDPPLKLSSGIGACIAPVLRDAVAGFVLADRSGSAFELSQPYRAAVVGTTRRGGQLRLGRGALVLKALELLFDSCEPVLVGGGH
jgi:hypothetical protein